MGEYKYVVYTQCNTYNQVHFIKEALDGFVKQVTSFPVIYAICDDCSTDGEVELLKSWAQDNLELDEQQMVDHREESYGELFYGRYKHKKNSFFVILLLNTNLYSLGKHHQKQDYLREWLDVSKYRAFCEGDDYWITPDKLQKQVEFLENNSIYSAITSNSLIIDCFGKEAGLFSKSPSKDITLLDELVIKRQFHTASVLCRNIYFDSYFYKLQTTWDTFFWCWLAVRGPIKYMNESTCVYRKGGQGVTRTTSRLKWVEINENWSNILYAQFGPKYLSYVGAYLSLTRDILSLLILNKTLSDEERKIIKNKYHKYANWSINIKNIPFVFTLYRNKLITLIRNVFK
jgi:hypothetical protein